MYPKLVNQIREALSEHKIKEIKIISLKETSPFADYYIIGTAMNERQLLSMEDYIGEAAIKAGVEIIRQEGSGESGWIIYDCGDVIVHLFLDSIRQEINLEGLVEKIKEKQGKRR